MSLNITTLDDIDENNNRIEHDNIPCQSTTNSNANMLDENKKITKRSLKSIANEEAGIKIRKLKSNSENEETI